MRVAREMETFLNENKKQLIPYGKGYLVANSIEIVYQGNPKSIPAGSIVHNFPRLKIKSTLSTSQLRKTLSYAYAAKTLKTRFPQASNLFLYTNRRSGYLVNAANRILLRASSTAHSLTSLKDEFLINIRKTLNNQLTKEIDANAERHDEFFRAQAPNIPVINQCFIDSNEPDILTEAKNRLFLNVINNPPLLQPLTEINTYYQKYHPSLSKALNGEVDPQTHSLLEDNIDFFPSNLTLSAIATKMKSITTAEGKRLFKGFVNSISMLLCNTYIFLEIFDAISIKLHNPKTLLVTKYSLAETYTASINSCIALVCAAIQDKLDPLLNLMKTGKSGYDLSLISKEAPVLDEYAKKLSIPSSMPVYKSLLSAIGIESLYSHKLEASRFNSHTNLPSNVKILPDPFGTKKRKSPAAETVTNMILMVCWNEIYAGETVDVEQIRYKVPGGASIYNRLAFFAMNHWRPSSPTGSTSSSGSNDDTEDPLKVFATKAY